MPSAARRLRDLGLRGVTMAADRYMGRSVRVPGAVEPSATGTAPILVVGPRGGGFARYYPEILRTEGFTTAETVDARSLDAAGLVGRRVVVVAAAPLGDGVVRVLAEWVESGGC